LSVISRKLVMYRYLSKTCSFTLSGIVCLLDCQQKYSIINMIVHLIGDFLWEY
jgi:hypothetical protein